MSSFFPDQFKVAFVNDGSITADAIVSKLKPIPKVTRMSADVKRIWCYLLSFLHQATEEGRFIIQVQ